MEQLTPQQSAAISQSLKLPDLARQMQQNIGKGNIFYRWTMNLTTAKLRSEAELIGNTFRSVKVESCTDQNTTVNLLPVSKDAHIQHAVLAQGDVINFDFPITDGFLYWAAQSGKEITLLFNLVGTFFAGKLLSVNSGGVVVNEGSNAPTTTWTTLVAAAAAVVIAAQDLNRKVSVIYNDTGSVLYVGPSGVDDSGANKGYPVQPGQFIEWRNTAALYGYSAAGGAVLEFLET